MPSTIRAALVAVLLHAASAGELATGAVDAGHLTARASRFGCCRLAG